VWEKFLVGELDHSLIPLSLISFFSFLLNLSFLEEFVPGLILGHSLSSGTSHCWGWHHEVNIILIIVVVELNVSSISHFNRLKLLIIEEVISVLAVIKLDVLMMWLSLMVVLS
jgi:hypothetical protein